MKKIVKYFLQGLLLLSPLIGTAYIFALVFSVIDNSANDIILDFFDRKIKGLGFILTLSVITVFGFLSSTILFRGIFIWIENLLLKSTVVRLIYTSIKDLSNAFVGENKKFNKPVLVNLQKDSGIYKLGFITQESMSLIDQKELIAVYLPMSYSFAGDLFLVEKEYIKAIDINNVEAMKFVVSGGVTHLDKTHTSNYEDSNDKTSD